MSNKNNNWIKIYHDVFGVNKLTPQELYLYGYIFRNRVVYDEHTITNIDIINKNCEFSFIKGDEQKNKKIVKNILLSLKAKNYINCELSSNTKYSDLLIVTFPYGIENGFNKHVTYGVFDTFKDPFKFYIYCYIDCFGDKGRTISDNKWIEILKDPNEKEKKTLGKTKIRELINEMNETIIYKFSGDYYLDQHGSPKQNVNTYFTRPDDKILELFNTYQNNIDNRKNKKNCMAIEDYKQNNSSPSDVIEEETSEKHEEKTEEIEWGNWKGASYLSQEDYLLYVKQEHILEFKTKADAKLNRITSNGTNEKAQYKVDTSIDEAIKEFKRTIERENREKEKTRNAIIYYNSKEKVFVDTNNIDSIDFEDVAQLFYINNGTLSSGLFVKMADAQFKKRSELNNNQFAYIVKEYKKIVRQGKIIDVEDILKIRTELPQ